VRNLYKIFIGKRAAPTILETWIQTTG